MDTITIKNFRMESDALPNAKKVQEVRKTVDGINYHYALFIPSGYREGLPLVVEMHGGGGNCMRQARCTAWAELAERENFIVVYPSANYPDAAGHINWRCQSDDFEDEKDYIMGVTEIVAEEYKCDRERIYASGMSFGDYASLSFATKYADKLAGLCSFNGPTNPKEWDKTIGEIKAALPVIQIRGELDVTLPWPGADKYSEKEAFDIKKDFFAFNRRKWMDKNGCSLYPEIITNPKFMTLIYRAEETNCDLVYVDCRAMGHVEPMFGMEYAWEHCFSKFRRTKQGIERIKPADDIVMSPEAFVVAEGVNKLYRNGQLEALKHAPVMAVPEPMPEPFWCKVFANDFSRQSCLFADIETFAEIVKGEVQGNSIVVNGTEYTFYKDACLVSTPERHFALEKAPVEIDGALWFSITDALHILGYHAWEVDGVIYSDENEGCLTKGVAYLTRDFMK